MAFFHNQNKIYKMIIKNKMKMSRRNLIYHKEITSTKK